VIRVANAPCSYGAFEITAGRLPNVPPPDEVLAAIAAAGYAGTELGPPGYLGTGADLRQRLESNRLDLVGAFVELRFGDEDEDLTELETSLDSLDGYGAKPVLADAGPRAGPVDWARLAEGVGRAAELARRRGFEPTVHPHMGTRFETPSEIEELLARTDVGLLLDTGHLVAAGGDPVHELRDWHERVNHVHVKDVRLDILRRAPEWGEAWRAGVFCELGAGDVDLESFFAELAASRYEGWLVVEQDWVPGPGDDAAAAAAAQARNRKWLSEHVGL
jgi:inosose dehydratase